MASTQWTFDGWWEARQEGADRYDEATAILTVDDVSALLVAIGDRMLADSRHWFPKVHQRDAHRATTMHFALGLGGETGEVLDIIKKVDACGKLVEQCEMHTDGKHSAEALGSELADVLTYLLALAAHEQIDIFAAYTAKRDVNIARWGES